MAVEIKCDLCGIIVPKLEDLDELKIGPRGGFLSKKNPKDAIIGDICKECKVKVVNAIRKLKTNKAPKKKQPEQQDTSFLGQNRKNGNQGMDDPLMGLVNGIMPW